jgi:hypothetical protein
MAKDSQQKSSDGTPRPPQQSVSRDGAAEPQSAISNPQSQAISLFTLHHPLPAEPTGYVSRRIDGLLTQRQANTLRRLAAALQQESATVQAKSGELPVDSHFRAVQFLLDRVADRFDQSK